MDFNAITIGLALAGGLLVAIARLRRGFTNKPLILFHLTVGSWGVVLILLSILLTIIEGMMMQ